MQNITFITGNPAKAQYLQDYFEIPVNHQKIDLPEIQSLDLKELTRHKAEAAYAQVGSTVLVEDVSLEYIALNGLPGPFIRWFLERLGNDGLCSLLSGTDRRATARVVFCLYDGNEHHFFEGETKGFIAERPQGEKNFGWDPIFIPEGSDQTWSEMSSEEKDATSMRRKALDKLTAWLRLEA